MKTVLVLNPNSSVAVTGKMEQACGAIAMPPDTELVFRTLPGGPAGIETQRHVESVVIPVCDYFHDHPADIFVIGCFSDPGLHLAREELATPVLGIAECSLVAALELGARFGIVSIKQGSIGRHARMVRELGLSDRMAADRPLDLGVLDLLDDDRAISRIISVGRRMRDEDGADVLILGCATMGVYRPRVEAALQIPVVDPAQAAVLRAATHLARDASLS